MSKPPSKRFSRVLIANRGEIAVRIARTLRDMGIAPVAVFSDADRLAPHVRACDYAFHIGPAAASESYLVIDKIIEVAKRAKADAIHPGYGFLSENEDFAEAVEKAGLAFIGPPANAIRTMGSKTGARETVIAAGVPVVPGANGPFADEAAALHTATEMGFPVMLKAASGGGGKGMRLVKSADEMKSAYRAARSEAKNAFGDDTVYLEKAIIEPKHVEIQIFGGPDGKCVWLGERECSMQRRHQKVIEETPSPAIDEATRRKMGEVACKAGESVGYVGAGTVEFLVDRNKNFYFLEMNTRLQVEHPVTELCCGVDLVEAQVRVAQGEPLPWTQEQIRRTGAAIEARIYAEDPAQNFMPCPGYVEAVTWPQGPGVRIDAGVSDHFEVPRFYDPMIAKIAAWGQDREHARKRLIRSLEELAVKGITTNTAFLRRLLDLGSFKDGTYHTGSIAEMLAEPVAAPSPEIIDVAMAVSVVHRFRKDKELARQAASSGTGGGGTAGWRSSGWRWRNG